MRGRNKMRFSAPQREPPGGRASRGAKLKGRGGTRQKDAAVRTLRLGGTGAAKKAPSEQGATKAAGLGAANARWSRASGVQRSECRGTAKSSGGVGQGRQPEKAHDEGAQHFFRLPLGLTLASTKAGARSGDAGNTDFPLLLN